MVFIAPGTIILCRGVPAVPGPEVSPVLFVHAVAADLSSVARPDLFHGKHGLLTPAPVFSFQLARKTPILNIE